MVQCLWHTDKLTCSKQQFFLEALSYNKIKVIPRVIANHYLFMETFGQENLISTLLKSAPAVIHLTMQNYQITLNTIDICPKLIRELPPQGCYACLPLATITIKDTSHVSQGKFLSPLKTSLENYATISQGKYSTTNFLQSWLESM